MEVKYKDSFIFFRAVALSLISPVKWPKVDKLISIIYDMSVFQMNMFCFAGGLPGGLGEVELQPSPASKILI